MNLIGIYITFIKVKQAVEKSNYILYTTLTSIVYIKVETYTVYFSQLMLNIYHLKTSLPGFSYETKRKTYPTYISDLSI